MRYFVNRQEIRSENSAKPDLQSSRFIEERIGTMTRCSDSLNYGSGKLRFVRSMLNASDRLTLVDSTVQINRKQLLPVIGLGNYEEYCRRTNSVSIMTTKELCRSGERFDRAFCLNVLAIIPFPSIRTEVLKRIRRSLKENGQLIVSNRWRNSEFTSNKSRPDAQIYKGGTLIHSLRGYAFYYQMSEGEIISTVLQLGFSLESSSRRDGTYFIVFTKS